MSFAKTPISLTKKPCVTPMLETVTTIFASPFFGLSTLSMVAFFSSCTRALSVAGDAGGVPSPTATRVICNAPFCASSLPIRAMPLLVVIEPSI
nr:MAG: hypothetical protein [Bacteriophage sp.]